MEQTWWNRIYLQVRKLLWSAKSKDEINLGNNQANIRICCSIISSQGVLQGIDTDGARIVVCCYDCT